MQPEQSKQPKIYGFNKSSEASGNPFNASVFLKGCNMRCPFCMNCRLVTGDPEPLDLGSIEAFIKENKPEMVMISGGEPTFDFDNIVATVEWIHKLGCEAGLSTNGLNNYVLSYVLGGLFYVALDIKGFPIFYQQYTIGNRPTSAIDFEKNSAFFRVMESWKMLRDRKWENNNFSYEIRTTLCPSTQSDAELLAFLGQFFVKGEKWVLQPFRITDEIMDENIKAIMPYSQAELNRLLKIAQSHSEATVELRRV